MKRYRKDEVRRAVESKAPADHRSGKEEIYWIYIEGRKRLKVTVPKGRGSLHPNTAGKIRDQLRLAPDEFAAFVRCPLTGTGYERLLMEKLVAGQL